MTVSTLIYIYPIATIFIGFVYICSYRFYLTIRSNDLLAIKLKFNEIYGKLYSKYNRANENMFEYVIHHETEKIIDITNELKIEMEKKWHSLTYLYDRLSFKYKDKRSAFHLMLKGSLTFRIGEAILINGNSGAGKCITDFQNASRFFYMTQV